MINSIRTAVFFVTEHAASIAIAIVILEVINVLNLIAAVLSLLAKKLKRENNGT